MHCPPLSFHCSHSAGDDGLGGIDDTDDITGIRGTLISNPSVLRNRMGGFGVTAAVTARVNMNALAVRLALPLAAAGSDMEGMAAEKAQVRTITHTRTPQPIYISPLPLPLL